LNGAAGGGSQPHSGGEDHAVQRYAKYVGVARADMARSSPAFRSEPRAAAAAAVTARAGPRMEKNPTRGVVPARSATVHTMPGVNG